MSTGRKLLIGGALAGLVQIVVLWGTSIPLGVPGEWTWARSERFFGETVLSLLPALLAGGLLVTVVVLLGQRMESATPRGRGVMLCLLALFGTGWLLTLVSSVPGIAGLSRGPFVLYYTRSSGYFWQARYEVESLSTFLKTYTERIQDSTQPENYLHLGTHPPGLTTGYFLLLRLVEQVPALERMALATQPEAVRESLAVIRDGEFRSGRELTNREGSVLWLAMLITAAMSTATLLPLYGVARRSVGAKAAWWTAAFWLTVPAIAVFYPKSDLLLPVLAMLSQWLWLEALDRDSMKWGAGAAAVALFSMLLSLAYLPVALMLGLQFLLRRDQSEPATQRRWPWGGLRWRPVLGVLLIFVTGIALLALLTGLNLIAVWLQNIRNHAAFYDNATRTWWKWTLENPLELGFSLALPLFLISLTGLRMLLFSRRSTGSGERQKQSQTESSPRGELLVTFAVWAVLWLSGKNMGEAARLWIFLMPFAVLYTCRTFEELFRERFRPSLMAGLFAVQLFVGLGTVHRLDGFHFAELLGSRNAATTGPLVSQSGLCRPAAGPTAL